MNNNPWIAEPGSVMEDGAVGLLVVQNGLDWSPGRVQWLGRSYKGVFPRNRDRPSQMKHPELKNRPFLFRVSFCLPASLQAGHCSCYACLALSDWERPPESAIVDTSIRSIGAW